MTLTETTPTDTLTATLDTPLGEIKAGWDVAIAKMGFSPQLDTPTVVGVIVRVPGEANPAKAAEVALSLGGDFMGEVPEGEEIDTLRVVVYPFDGFGEE